MTERQTHIATIELKEAAPAEVPVGTTFVVKLAVACTEGCDLHASVWWLMLPPMQPPFGKRRPRMQRPS